MDGMFGMTTRRRTRIAALVAAAAAAAVALVGPAAHADTGLSTRNFESDAVGSVPVGCATPSGRAPALVSDERAYQSSHSLRVDDTSATSLVTVTCPAPAQQGAYLSFRVFPAALANGFQFDLDGDALIGTGLDVNAVFHLTGGPNGDLRWYDGGSWRPLAPAGTVPVGQWSLIELAVPADNSAVHVTVDGTYVGSGGPAIGNNSGRHNAINAITGYGFASSGTAALGDDAFIDDVTFGSAADIPPGATGTAPFQVGDASVIDNVGQVQLPTSDVVVPHDGGQRVLADYPAHADNSQTNGNRLAYSDDGGTTWVGDQAANPMPDAPSFFMTRLRNGDVLAVDYHTYMVQDSGDLQAEVDLAVSHDGGATWTNRTGTMTTPQPMRTISSVTDRPGSPLGGFVLVHSVVEDPDGTLYQSGYGYYAVDTKYRQIVMVSHDQGLTWTVQGTVATADPTKLTTPGYEGPCEGAFERVADGSLLIVMRNGSYLPMTYSRSTDNGRTWSAPQPVAAGAQAQPVYSVFPTLELMPTGELVLLFGRPGLVMTVSADGIGDDWSTPVGIDYVNSENSAFAALDPSRVLVLGDRGRVSPWAVWSRVVTIDQPCAQTVTGVHDGPLTAGAGGLCLDDATVTGPVTVSSGGRLVVTHSTVHGPVSASGAGTVALCGSTVDGRVALSGTTGNVAVGDTTRGCDPDTVGGPLTVSGTGGRVVIDRTAVAGPVLLTGNRGALATVLAGARVEGPLACSDNTVAPTDSGVEDTVAGPASGQCRALA